MHALDKEEDGCYCINWKLNMKTKLYGALLGDCIGSPYEFNNYKGKDFQLFDENRSFFTDDSVMTIAIAEALLDHPLISMRYGIVPVFAKYMQKWGKMYPDAGYGGRLSRQTFGSLRGTR